MLFNIFKISISSCNIEYDEIGCVMKVLFEKVALVTGASRGVGACVAQGLAQAGADVVLNYRNKASRATKVADSIRAAGVQTMLAQADICNRADVDNMYRSINEQMGRLDLLVLNASGGLEKDKAKDYAMQLNHDAQLQLVEHALPLMSNGGQVIFITSHLAHFYGQKPVYAAYESVAVSKHAGEQALRERIPELSKKGIRFLVVSGDLIEGTITPKLMQRGNRGLIDDRRQQVGALPTVNDFANAIVAAILNHDLPTGAVTYVGSTSV
jgi:3-oxoacyl-[acyl-carrier protein] reductase